MSEQLFKDRVRERDLDNFLVEELHASLDFRDWLLARLEGRFDAPPGCEVKLQKSPARLQDSRQTDVQIGWFDGGGDIRARVLIESKVTEDFQPGQAEAYMAEVEAARSALGRTRAASVLVAPAGRLGTLLNRSMFDANIAIEDIADALEARRSTDLTQELDARLVVRIQLLEALCGKRPSAGWIASTVPEKRDFAEAYAALARERLPELRVRPSTDGPKAISRLFQGLTLQGLPTPKLRHEFGRDVAWKWVNAQFPGMGNLVARVASSGLLSGTGYSAEKAGESLAIRIRTPGVNPESPFPTQREAVIVGLDALGELVEWLRANSRALAAILGQIGAAPPVVPEPINVNHRDPKELEHQLVAALRDIYAECATLNYHPTGLLEMIEYHGGRGTVRRLLEQKFSSEGFARLAMLGRLDLSVESLVLQPRWGNLFSEDERRIARRRLKS